MSDKSATFILRGALYVVLMLATIFITMIVDLMIDKLSQHYLELSAPRTIETAVFLAIVSGSYWAWLCRRVWVGRQAQ